MLSVRKSSTIISGAEEKNATTRPFDKPFVKGACSVVRRDRQARKVIDIANSALPIAPAVVPSVGAPRPTVVKSIRTAAKLIVRHDFVLPAARSDVMWSMLCAEKLM